MGDVSPAPALGSWSRGELLARAGRGVVSLVSGGLVLGVATNASAAAGGDRATVGLLLAGERLAIALYGLGEGELRMPLPARSYLSSALAGERDHAAALADASGVRASGARAVRLAPGLSGDPPRLLAAGTSLESALLGAYLGAVRTLRSSELRGLAATIAASEAQHLSAVRRLVSGRLETGPAMPEPFGPARGRAALAADVLAG